MNNSDTQWDIDKRVGGFLSSSIAWPCYTTSTSEYAASTIAGVLQDTTEPSPIVCTYLGRSDNKSKRPFRFILNHSNATVANVWRLACHVSQPAMQQAIQAKPDILRQIWQTLNSIDPEQLLGEGRVYGGGLHKVEPKELGNVPVPELAQILSLSEQMDRQAELVF